MNFLQRVLDRLLPPRKNYRQPVFHEPSAVASTMDADALLATIRQAEGGAAQPLFSLMRDYLLSDSHLLTEFSKRKMQLLKNPLFVRPADPKSPDQVALAAALQKEIEAVPDWFSGINHLLDGCLFPVAYVQKFYKPAAKASPFRYSLASLEPLPLATRLDYAEGRPRIARLDGDGAPLAEFDEVSTLRHICHRGHLIQNLPDCWGGPFRAILFWLLFKSGNRQFWAQNLERWNSPFIVGYYDSNTPEDKYLLESAFAESQRLFGLVVNTGAKIDLKETKGGQADAFAQFHEVANAEISKLISGQTMLSDAKSTGLGSNQAVVHQSVFADIGQFDGQCLTATLKRDVVDPFLRLNGINLPGPEICYGEISAPEPHQPTVELLKVLSPAGLEVADAAMQDLSDRLGILVQRSASGGVPTVGLAAENSIAAHLRQSLRADAAPILQILRDSESPEDFNRRAGRYFRDWSPAKTAAVLEEAIVGIV